MHNKLEIHSTAIVHANAKIGQGTSVGPYSVIGEHVSIGCGNRIGSHVVIEGYTNLGDENQVYQFASVGSAPQDLKYKGEASRLEIGNKNIIREYVTLQPGTANAGMLTRIGDGNLFMACSHVGHDAQIGNGNVFANSAALAGHVEVGNRVTVGGMVGVHQFVRIGDLSLLGAGAMVAKDIPPFCMAQGDRAKLIGINRVGLERAGFQSDEIVKLRAIYRELFNGSGHFRARLEQLLEREKECSAAVKFLQFILDSKRGVSLPRSKTGESDQD